MQVLENEEFMLILDGLSKSADFKKTDVYNKVKSFGKAQKMEWICFIVEHSITFRGGLALRNLVVPHTE